MRDPWIIFEENNMEHNIFSKMKVSLKESKGQQVHSDSFRPIKRSSGRKKKHLMT